MENLKKALIKLFQQRSTNTHSSNKNMKTYRTDLKDLKLEVLLFTHFMYEDDDKLSIFEKGSILKFLKENADSIPESTETQFKEWINNPPSLGYILDYAKKNNYSYEDLDAAIVAFVHYTDSNSKYHQVIRSVRRKLILEKDYLKH
jgi:hypothetical protein